MPTIQDFLNSIEKSSGGLTLKELLNSYPEIARRTAQRWVSRLIQEGRVHSTGHARARRYYFVKETAEDIFPKNIPLSADSRDILAYIDRPLSSRRPVGYQFDFLESYQPNKSMYLSASLRRQLHKMGATGQEKLAAGTYSRAILNRLLIDLSWASSHLEGNTYSRLDTRKLIERGQVAEGKAALETQMILNHKAAIELFVENAASIQFNRYTLFNLHSVLSENLLLNPADEGRIRQHEVEIGKSAFRPLAIPWQIEATFDLMLTKAKKIADPFEQSFFMMVHLPYLQPFADINKRTSRLVANLPLFRANLCPLTFLDVPEPAYSRAISGVYELTRVELLRDLYVWAYERSTQEYLAIKQNIAQPDPARLIYRDIIKKTICAVVTHPAIDPLIAIQKQTQKHIPLKDRDEVQALIIEELRRLHEGVLARYGLHPAEFDVWKRRQLKI